MVRPILPARLVSPLLLLLAVPFASASIQRLTLRQMVEKTDGAIFGVIASRSVSVVPMDDGSEELYFTTLTIQGRSLYDGQELSVSVSYPGGILDGERGVWNAEAPSEDDVAIGNQVVAFWQWNDNLGGGFACNELYAAHGGIYRTFDAKKGRIVQGRGEGYAVSANRLLTDLEKETRAERADVLRNR
jgi:hypothetical protein